MEEKEKTEKTKIMWDTPGNIAYDHRPSPPTYAIAYIFSRGVIPPLYGNTVIETENPITTAADFDMVVDYVRGVVSDEIGPYDDIQLGRVVVLNIMRLPL